MKISFREKGGRRFLEKSREREVWVFDEFLVFGFNFSRSLVLVYVKINVFF